MLNPVYRRILLKTSGEVLTGNQEIGVSPGECQLQVNKIIPLIKAGVQLGKVIGGGNIVRGASLVKVGLERDNADYIGLMATLMNAVTLNSYFNNSEIKSRVLSSLPVYQETESFNHGNAKRYLNNCEVEIFAVGIGNPYFTTDTASALRALKIDADILFKTTKVDGIYSDDPEFDTDAEKYINIPFDEPLKKELDVMEMTAFA